MALSGKVDRGTDEARLAPAPETFAVADGLPCPYLHASHGYRAGHASRDHTCDAVGARAHVRSDTQADVCLIARHVECETYREAQAATWRRREAAGPYRREIVATAPIVVAGGPIALAPRAPHAVDARLTALRARAGLRRAIAVVALALFGVIASWQLLPAVSPSLVAASATPRQPFAGSTLPVTPAPTDPITETPSAPAASPSEVPTIAPSPTPATTPSPTPLPTATPTGSTVPPATPGASSTPRIYVVQEHDTLSGIASQFGTTASKIAQANGLTLDSIIQPGQKLVIP